MASKPVKLPPCPVPLVSKELHVGDSIRIGRRPSCELAVNCPFISSVHCMISVTGESSTSASGERLPPINGDKNASLLRFHISDLSSNGTWVMKEPSKSLHVAEALKIPSGKKKLTSKVKEEIFPGDCVLLLAPAHKDCSKYCFMLKKKGSEYIVEQLPPSYVWNREKSKVGTSTAVNTATTEDGGSWESAVVSGKRSTESGCSDGGPKKHCGPSLSEFSKPKESTDLLTSGTSVKGSSDAAVEVERCPTCWKLFPVCELPLHSPICQDSATVRKPLTSSRSSTKEEVDELVIAAAPDVSKRTSKDGLSSLDSTMEQCPHCLGLFPLEVLISHAETCSLASSSSTSGSSHSSSRSSRSGSSESEKMKILMRGGASVNETSWPVDPPLSLSKDTSVEQCPYCSDLLPVAELITHCVMCKSTASSSTSKIPVSSRRIVVLTSDDLADIEADSVSVKRARYTLDTWRSGSKTLPSSSSGDAGTSSSKTPRGGASFSTAEVSAAGGKPRSFTKLDGADELEQCVHCLQEFPISELVNHAAACSKASSESGTEMTLLEHCQHCLNVFPLNDLVAHALNCSQRKDLGSLETDDGVVGDEEMWGEPLERCMHCFKDFPLSKMVGHSRKCKGDMLGSRERFKNFLPSVHDLDAMSLAVLNEAQMRAVEYVMEVSKKESESVYTNLRDRVIGLGFSEHDLEKTLQWIRRDAPIIIHLRLDTVLKFLVKDTHYRNLFETHTGSGCLDTSTRSSWEDRIFNNLYRGSAPVDRVKYGVLNIVGDPRGVSCCSGYGDSFLQLKKVRLRTTFASQDTSSSLVVLSCCEHYGNVLYRYNNSELKAILEVATRKVEFLRSDIISQYKEIQIHGPVCLSENVDCIVVNERHSADPTMKELLDQFVSRNKCNLIWMEPADRIDYPSFTHAPAVAAGFSLFVPPPLPIFSAPALPAPAPLPTRRRRRRRRRRAHDHDWY